MAANKVTPELVRHVAQLARLQLSDEHLTRLATQLDSILEYVNQIEQVDVTGTQPMAHALAISNVFRDDVVEPSLPLEKVLQNSPACEGPFFKVPKVLGAEEDSAG